MKKTNAPFWILLSALLFFTALPAFFAALSLWPAICYLLFLKGQRTGAYISMAALAVLCAVGAYLFLPNPTLTPYFILFCVICLVGLPTGVLYFCTLKKFNFLDIVLSCAGAYFIAIMLIIGATTLFYGENFIVLSSHVVTDTLVFVNPPVILTQITRWVQCLWDTALYTPEFLLQPFDSQTVMITTLRKTLELIFTFRMPVFIVFLIVILSLFSTYLPLYLQQYKRPTPWWKALNQNPMPCPFVPRFSHLLLSKSIQRLAWVSLIFFFTPFVVNEMGAYALSNVGVGLFATLYGIAGLTFLWFVAERRKINALTFTLLVICVFVVFSGPLFLVLAGLFDAFLSLRKRLFIFEEMKKNQKK